MCSFNVCGRRFLPGERLLSAERRVAHVGSPLGVSVQPVRRRLVEVGLRPQLAKAGRNADAFVANDRRRLDAASARRRLLLDLVAQPEQERCHQRSVIVMGGTIHRCIDISRYFSRDMYRDIIFYNHNFFFFFSPQLFSFRQKRYIIISTCGFCKVIPQIL